MLAVFLSSMVYELYLTVLGFIKASLDAENQNLKKNEKNTSRANRKLHFSSRKPITCHLVRIWK